MRIILCLSLTLGVAFANIPRDHDCVDFRPRFSGTESDELAPLDKLSFSPVQMESAYVHGSKVKVHIELTNAISTFILQARNTSDDKPVGTWETDPQNLQIKLYDCLSPNNTVGNLGYNPTKTITAFWESPDSEKETAGYEFVFGVTNPDGTYWNDIRAENKLTMRSEPLPAGEIEAPQVPSDDKTENEVDLHDAKREEEMALEWQKKVEEMTAQEDAESEGEWTKKAAMEKLKHEDEIHQEMIEYEEKLAKDEDERQARIRAEIVDKEEWEREQIKKKEEEDKFRPDGNEVGFDKEKGLVVGDGAASIVASVATLLLSMFALYL